MRSHFILPLLVFFNFQILFSQSDAILTGAEIGKLMDKLHQNGQFNGTVLVADNGKVLYKGAHGYGDFETKRKLVIESPCYLASVSKQFTTMAIMILNEKGKLNYDDPLTKYFPEFPDYAKNVTIRQMMEHTSGVANHYDLGIYKPGLTNEDVLQALIKQENLNFTPGEKYSYSNGAYVLLSMIVEKISGQPFSTFMKKNIFAPLEMENTCVFDKNTPAMKNRAIGYTPAWTKEDYEIYTTGAGGMYSTVEDLFKWDQALYTDKLISKKTLEEAFTSAKLNDGSETGYGFGWGIGENEDGGKIVRHSGGLNGFRTFIERDLQHKRTIILLTNNGSTYLNGVLDAIRNIQNGKAYEMPKINIGQKLHGLIEEIGIEKALVKYNELKTNDTGEYDFSESQLNNLGYYFMGEKDYETAIAIFRQNVKSFPDAYNTYDSLAEAYMEGAIENYKKSLELNPGNENARKMLGKMSVDVSDVEKEVEVPEKILEKYVGKYELNPAFAITITKEGKQLKAQATNQPQFEIYPQSENKFYLKVVAAQIEFNSNDRNEIESLTLFQGGQEMVFMRIE